jgi:hypothetical protein
MTVNPSIDRAPLMAKLRHSFGWMNDPRRDRRPFVGFMDALEVDGGSQAALRNLIETACGLPRSIMVSRTLSQLLAENSCANEVQRRAMETAAFARIQTRNQLSKLVDVINAMASAPGVKQLVILSGGVALRPAESADFVPVAQAAAAAGVQLTIMMEEPDDRDLSHPAAGAHAMDQRQMMQQAQTLAEFSGGQFFRVIGQADRFYQRVLVSASAIYRLGVDLPTIVPQDGNYKIEVTIKRPGVKVHASRYAAPPPPPKIALTPDEQMTDAIKTGTPSYALPVQMSAEVVPAQGASPSAIRVSLAVAGDVPGPISCIFGMVGPDQVLKSGRRDLPRSRDGKTFHLDFLVPATVGTYDLRFAAADASGAVGSTTQQVVVK